MREMNEKREKADWVPAVRQEKVEEVITAGSLFMDKNVPDVNNVWVLMAFSITMGMSAAAPVRSYSRSVDYINGLLRCGIYDIYYGTCGRIPYCA